MAISRLLAAQLGNPTGIFGKFTALMWNRRNAALNETALQALTLQPTDRVLEIGFGGGYLLGRMLPMISGGLVAGVDISPAMVKSAARKYEKAIGVGRLELKCAAAESLPFPAGHFTNVCSVNSIFYWQDVELGIEETGRVLVQSGQMVLCFTCKASLEKRPFAKSIRLFEPSEIETFMAASRFREIKVAHFSDRHRQYVCMTGKQE